MKRRDADRRGHPRFEVVGDLWGSLESVLRLPLRNIGLSGALVESRSPLAPDSIHRITWDADEHETSTQGRVCHVRQTSAANGERVYLIGVEFVSRTPAVAEQIQRWLSEPQSDVSGA